MNNKTLEGMADVYLGDGLYASYDGFTFCLRAPHSEGDQEVYLEPEVLRAFQAFVSAALRAAAGSALEAKP